MPDLPEPEPDELDVVNIDFTLVANLLCACILLCASDVSHLSSYLHLILTPVPIPTKARGDESDTSGLGLWEDAESKSFYEQLTDLRAHVPEILYKVESPELANGADGEGAQDGDANTDEASNVADIAAAAAVAQELENNDDNAEVGDDTQDTTDYNAEDGEGWDDGLTETDPLRELLDQLPNCVNIAAIDKAAIEFCQHNTKGSRKRLALALFKVRRSRLDLLPVRQLALPHLHYCDMIQPKA